MENKKNIDLSAFPESDILDLRICDLPLSIEGTYLKDRVNELYSDLDKKGISFKPECYLADEWLTPDGEPVIGIPFFLAHPVLVRLERKMMLEVEGGNKQWCMKLLRHEAGHAFNYAYKLYRRKQWQRIFGKFTQEYKDTYRFRPYSKSFVKHLEDYYAQYHPDEDFAETFAVWLNPQIDWKKQYAGWKALEKLNYVDDVFSEIKGKPPLRPRGEKYWRAAKLRIKLKNFYRKKKQVWAESFPDFHDVNLKRIFGENKSARLSAADLIRDYRKEILNSVSFWTGEKKYIIDDLLGTLIQRCRSLKLVAEDKNTAVLKVSVYITALIMNYVYTGTFRRSS